MDTTAYLRRIAYDGPLDPTLETLRGLHQAHLLAVPFENLDVGLRRPIVLDEQRLFDKIVTRRRGGFCYELNGLFAELLRTLGFEVTLLSAEVARGDGGFGRAFDHLALMVSGKGEGGEGEGGEGEGGEGEGGEGEGGHGGTAVLVDVGFGDSFRVPLGLDGVGEQVEGERAYRIDRDGEGLMLMRRESDGAWQAQYRFTLQARHFAEFAEMCHFHQTSPESSFTRRHVCTLATPDGRITLSDRRLITTTSGVRQELELADEEAWRATLRERFGVELDI